MAIDWAALIGFKDRDQLLADVAAKMRDAGSRITNWSKLGRLRTIVESALQPVAELYVLALKVVPQGFLHYSTGQWLAAHGEAMSDAPKPATHTEGRVRLLRAAGGSGNVSVPASVRVGTRVGSDGARIVFAATGPVVLVDGAQSVELPVRAELAGSSSLVGPETIVELLTSIPGIAGVTNDSDWVDVEGADAESDDAFRARLELKWTALGFGSNRDAYESWALSVDGVTDVRVDDQHPRGQGSVDVYVSSAAGTPSAALLQAVDAVVQEKRTLTANVLILAPEAVEVPVHLRLWMHPTLGSDEDAQAEAETLVAALFTTNTLLNAQRLTQGKTPINRLRIAEDVRPLRMQVLAAEIPYVVDVDAIEPAAPVTIGPGQIAELAGPVVIEVQRLEEV